MVKKINKNRGFTIVELLIVIVVIAILAAISIVAYTGIQDSARSAAATTSARQVADKIGVYAVENEQYPASLSDISIANNGSTAYQYRVSNTSDPKTWCVTATVGNKSFYTSNAQSTPREGACTGHGSGGAPAITNLITNPSAELGIAGWSTFGGATVTPSTEWASSGSQSLKASSSSTTNQGDIRIGGGGLTSFALNTLEPGKTYTMSARVRIPTALTGSFDRGPGILYWYSTNGSTYQWNPGPKVYAAGTHTVSHTFTIPSNATGAIIGLGVASSTANQVVYYDSIILTEGETAYTYADGDSQNWVWNGTAHSSTSTGAAL